MRILVMIFSLLLVFPAWSKGQGENPLQAQAQLLPLKISAQQGVELRIQLKLPAQYRAYAEHFALKLPQGSGFHLGSFKIEPQHEFFDENSKKTRKGVMGEATLVAAMEAPAILEDETSPLRLRLTYQACTKTYCLFPTTIEVPVEFKIDARKAASDTDAKSAGNDSPTATGAVDNGSSKNSVESPKQNSSSETSSGGLDQSLLSVLNKGNLAFAFLMIFLAGVLTSLTPCIFPMIPITLAVLGRSAHARTHTQTFLVSVVYVLGLALTYSALGVFAASTGVLFGSFMSSPWVLGFVCLVFLAMSLSMFGLYDLDFPALQNRLGHLKLEGYPGAFITGMIAGIIAGPCVGPVLVGILTYVAQTKNMWIGFWALFVFALGMGLLFLVLGVSSSATKLLPKSGEWMDRVKHFFGILMLFAFYYYLRLLVPVRIFDAGLGIGAVLFGSLLGAFDHPLKTTWEKIRKGLCQAIILVGAFFLIVAIFDLRETLHPRVISEVTPVENIQAWQPYSEALMKKAVADNKPVILDFFADWCAACKELEQYTFADPKFQHATKDFVLLRFDATNDSPELEALKKKYDIVGLPTVVFHDTKGNWVQDVTLTAFEKTDDFLKRFEKLNNSH